MIEEIKKLKRYTTEELVINSNGAYYINIETISLERALEILDKYDNQNKAKEQYGIDTIKILEQKYNYRIDMEESPYCEVCGHCGEIGCCGIRGFIEEHIKGKTNCKNEDGIVQDLISICEYETEVFKKNDTLAKGIDELIKKYEGSISQTADDEYFNDEMCKYGNLRLIYTEIIQDLKKLKGE